jgi:hypothetical protein
MTQENSTLTREAAERRVREFQERQMESLLKGQERERRDALRDQKLALDHLSQREEALKEERRLALERLEREWQQQRDRLGAIPSRAPIFDLGGARPQRDLQDEYSRARAQYAVRRSELTERFDDRLTGVERERGATLETFQKANTERERLFEEERAGTAQEQQQGFEILVHRQMQRGEKAVKREFTRRSRDASREI